MNKEQVIELRNLNLQLDDLKAKRAQLKKLVVEHRDGLTTEEIKGHQKEATEIRSQIQEIQNKIKEAEERAANNKGDNMEILEKNNKALEERALEFKATKRTSISKDEVRSILLSSGGIATPTKVGGINDAFPANNTVIDQVTITDATGCGQFNIAFQKADPTAAKKTDGTALSGSDATFGTAPVKPYLVGVTSYVSKELKKQSPLEYYSKVKTSALRALRTKVASLIFNGDSTDFYGIKNAVDTGSNSMVETYAVTATNGNKPSATAGFLRGLVLSYGGDENAYGDVGVLYLNKKDLIALGDVRGTNEKKAIYEIIPDANPNTGIIKEGGFSVRYCISSQLTSLFDTAAATGTTTKTMIYGIPENYNLSLFGDYTIEESNDYKFAEGLVTIHGEVMCGGNVQVWKGFTVVTLSTGA